MGEYQTVNCPECESRGGTPDTGRHLYVYGEDRGFHCFRCGWHRSKGFPAGVDVEDGDFGDTARPLTFPTNGVEYHLREARPATNYRRALQYLRGRDLTDEQIEGSRVLYAITGRYAERVIFPIWDSSTDKILYFVARTIRRGAEPTYLNAPVPKNGYVYLAGAFPAETAVVVEGVFDAFAVASAGIPAIALLGKSVNRDQAKMIGAVTKSAIVALDEDAFSKSLEVSYRLSFYTATRRVDLPRGMDPDKLLKKEGAINLMYRLTTEMTELKKELTGETNEPIKRFTPVPRTGKRSRRVQALGGASELPDVPTVEEGEEPIHAAFGPDE